VKILYISNFYDSTGWSHAAIDNALALDAAGVQVVVRAIKLNAVQGEVPSRIRELEDNNTHGVDIVIQQVLPHLMDYNGKIGKNIGIYYTETSNFTATGWSSRINAMDEVWLPNEQAATAARNSGVTVPIHVVPQPVDVRKFYRSYEPLPFRKEYQDQFIFYTIGEANRRKNLFTLLKAFHTEFRPEEPVQLLIKTTADPQGLTQSFKDVRQNLRIFGRDSDYKQEIIITDYLNETDMMRLHQSCDCFVTASYGESICLPCLDSIGHGKTPIFPNHSGFLSYCDEVTGHPVKCREEPVFGVTDTFDHLFTSTENWYSVDQLDLQRQMRVAYSDHKLRQQKAMAGIAKIGNFSYMKVGQQMKGLLL
jgi:glycosyltransferase involved in cell wall biosynthesis